MSGVKVKGISECVLGVLEGGRGAQSGVWQYVPFNFLQFQEVTNETLHIFQKTWRSQMLKYVQNIQT